MPRDKTLLSEAESVARGLWRTADRLLRAKLSQVRGTQEDLDSDRNPFAVVLASIGDGVITTDDEGRVTYLNRVAEELTGWSLAQARGRVLEEVFRIVNEHTRKAVDNPVRRALRLGRIVGLANHTLLIARDGTERAIDDSASPIRDDDGSIAGVVLIFRDVTERRRSEAAQAQLAAIVNHSEDAIFAKTLEGVIQSWNAGARRLYGYTADEIVGKHVSTLVPEECLEQLQEIMARLQRGEATEHIETMRVRKDGSRVDVSLMVSPLRNAEGELMGASAVVRDITQQKLAEHALRNRERELADFFENAPVGLHSVGPDGTILRANRTELELLGYPEEEYVGRDIREFHVDGPVIESILERVLAGDLVPGAYARMRRKDGSVIDVRVHSSGQVDDGKFVRSRCFTHDVTEQLRAQRALRENEERLRLALDAGRMGTWHWDIDRGEVAWSPRTELLHGLEPGTFPGTFEALQNCVHPQDRQGLLAAIDATLSQGEDHHVQYRVIRRDGAMRWLEANGRLVRDGHGKPQHMFGVCMDVTERTRRSEAASLVADVSAELAHVVDYQSTLDKIARLVVPRFADWCTVDVVEPDGSLRRLAVAHVDPTKVALAHQLHERYPPDRDAPVGAYHILKTGEAEMIAEIPDALLVERMRDADHLHLARELGLRSYLGVPLSTRRGIIGVLTFIAAESGRHFDASDLELARDLAHRASLAIEGAELYRELQERDRRKDEFLATLSHELRNPLAPIRHAVEILRVTPPDAPARERALELLGRQVTQLVRLVDDLLEVSRITLGKLELRRERVTLSAVLDSALETTAPLIDAAEQHLETELPGDAVLLDGDPLRLSQVFSNLLLNASKYTPRGGRIRLSAAVEGDRVVVRVQDSGDGIAPDVLPRIFETFTQARSATDRTQGGLGIGLSLVRNLVELHGGEVQARSDGVGQGSEFTVRLPIANPSAESPSAAGSSSESAAAERKRRILVVDDNRDAALTLQMFLEMLGHTVRVAGDGEEALAAQAEFQPELVLLDIGLPKLNGYEVAARIRSEATLQPVLVALTGWGQEQDRQRSREAGFDQHFVKPVDPQDLRKLLSSLVSQRRGSQEPPA